MAVSRSPRSPQKAMATLLCLALVFSLGLIAASRKTDMHLIHDRHGGHLEHDHHRLFDHGHVGGMGHSKDPIHGVHPTLAARNGALNRYSWDTFSHRATTVGADGSRGIGETSLDTRFGGARDSSGGSGLGELSTGTAGSRTRVPGVQGSSSGDEEAFGDRHTGNFGGGVLSDEDDANRSERSSSRFNGEDNLDSFVVPVAKQSGGWMHEVWDETNHLTHEVEKLAGLRERHHGKERLGTQKTGSVSFRGSDEDDDDSFSDRDETMSSLSSQSSQSGKNKYAVDGRDKENDDLDFEKEIQSRPKEIDDEEDDEDSEAADDAQQSLFDREAIKGAKPKKSGIFW